MGLGMKSDSWRQGLEVGLPALIHLALTLMLPILLTVLIGCKKAKEERADYGPEVNAEAIDAELKAINDRASLAGIRLGQYVEYGVVRRLENSESMINMGGLRVRVDSVEDKVSYLQYTLKIAKSTRQANNTFKTVCTEAPVITPKPTGVSSPALSPATVHAAAICDEAETNSLAVQGFQPIDVQFSAKGLAKSVARARGANEPIRVSFHRLRTADAVMPPPARVKSRSDCGGLNPCEIPVRQIRFDMVIWFANGDKQRITFDFAFSDRALYLPFGDDFNRFTGLLVVDCRSTYVPVNGQNIYVRDCQSLDDFQK